MTRANTSADVEASLACAAISGGRQNSKVANCRADAAKKPSRSRGALIPVIAMVIAIGYLMPLRALAVFNQETCTIDSETGEKKCEQTGSPPPPPPPDGPITDIRGTVTWAPRTPSEIDSRELLNRWLYDSLQNRQTGLEPPSSPVGGAFASSSDGQNNGKDNPCPDMPGEAPTLGNPIKPSNGEKIETELDFQGAGEVPLYLRRTYSRYRPSKGLFGYYWSSNFDLRLAKSASGQVITVHRDDGRTITYNYKTAPAAGWYETGLEDRSKVIGNASGYTVYLTNKMVETYDLSGRITSQKNPRGVGLTFVYSGSKLISVTHTSGRDIEFGWTGDNLTSVKDPAGNVYTYGYVSSQINPSFMYLGSVTQPGTPPTTIAYHYELTWSPGALIGKSYNGVRYSTFGYDQYSRAISSEHSGGADRNLFAYSTSGGYQITTHTNPLGKQTTYKFQNQRLISVTGQPSTYCALSFRDIEYDPNGFPDSVTDFAENITDYDYSDNGQLDRKVEGAGTPQARETLYTWNADGQASRQVITGYKQTDYTYRTDGLLSSVTVTNLADEGAPNQARTTTYSYSTYANGMLNSVTVDGPLPGVQDAVITEFDAYGNRSVYKNGLGHAITYANYNALGLPGRITNANGGITDYTYDARGLVLTEKSYVGIGAYTTANIYDNRGRLTKTTAPDGVATNFFYDNNNRLIKTTRIELNSSYASQSMAMTGPESQVGLSGTDVAPNLRCDYCTPEEPPPPPPATCPAGVAEIDASAEYTITTGVIVAPTGVCQDCPEEPGDPGGPTNPPPTQVNAAAFISQTTPTSLQACKTATVTVKMRNDGNTTWTAAQAYRLGSINPVDNTRWGISRVAVPGTVAPGQTATFSYSIKAPPTPGAYNFQWRMVRDGVAWFGNNTTNKSISVLAPPYNNAAFVSKTVPTAMETGKAYTLNVQMKNSGTTTWQPGSYYLIPINDVDKARWGMANAGITAAVAPGQTASFNINVTAPAVGNYSLQWRMQQLNVAWFGVASSAASIQVQPPPPAPVGFQKFTYNLNGDVTKIETGIEYPAGASNLAMESEGLMVPDDGMMHPNLCHPYPDCYEPPNPGDPDPPSWQTLVTSRAHIDYDELGRVRARRGEQGQIVKYEYDAADNVVSVTDSLGKKTTMIYDALNRVSTSTDPLAGVTRFAYDKGDQVIKVTDPRNVSTLYEYDGFGELWKQSSPDSGITTFAYDGFGNRTQMTRADGVVTTYTLDGTGRVTAATAGSETHTFVYDTCVGGKGMLCQVVDPKGQLDYTYSPHGWLLTQKQRIGSSAIAFGQAYAYDGLGRLTGISYPGNVAVGYAYKGGRMTTMTATIGGVVKTVVSGLTYQPFGPVVGLTYGNGLKRSYNFDIDGRLTGISTVNASSVIQSLTLGYNVNNDITKITNAANASLTQTYNYDALSRLTSVAATNANQSFGYDKTGNRTSHTWGGLTDTYASAATSNRLIGVDGPRAKAFMYNANGNITSAEDTLYNYDSFNRMSSAVKGGVTTSYWVNALGQRTYKSQGAPKANGYMYSPDDMLVAEYDWNGPGWTYYLRLGSEPIGIVRGGQLYFLHNDQLGRPESVTNSAKSVVWKASNYAFDRAVAVNSIGGLNLGLLGQYYDEETGNWYNGYRDYAPNLGRYLQSDPIGLAAGANTYAYVGGNPISYVDPKGLQFLPYSRNLNTKTEHRIPEGVAQRLNVVWGMTTAGAATAVYAPPALGASLMSPEAAAAAARVCKSPEVQEAALRVCIGIGVCAPGRDGPPDAWVDHVQTLQRLREATQRESQQAGRVTYPRP